MSDGESTTPAPRPRPSYGLPGPTGAAPEPVQGHARPSYGAPAQDAPWGAAPSAGVPAAHASDGGARGGGWGDPTRPDGSPQAAHDPFGPQTGPLPSSGAPTPRPRRRRGLWPLVSGLVLLLVIAPLALIVGIVWTVSSLSADITAGPQAMEGGTAQVEVEGNQMLIVYVPQEDLAEATCTVEGSSGGAITTVPSSTEVTFPDGSQYVQVLGAVAIEDTTATLSCTGTDAPVYMGPFDALGMIAPALIGAIVSVVAGLIGLVLTIVGIVLLLRSRRS